jgi:hypothetical protein
MTSGCSSSVLTGRAAITAFCQYHRGYKGSLFRRDASDLRQERKLGGGPKADIGC